MIRVLVLSLTLLLAACGSGAPGFHSSDITGADYARDFVLSDPSGRERRLGDFRGKAVAVFFGYTQCPDVCPTTLANMAEVMRQLGADAGRLQVIFVTLDPERDSPALLAQYVPAFDSRFLGLYGDAAATARVANDYKVFFQKREGPSPSSYTIDHTAATYIYDPQGRLRLYVRHGEKPENIVADLRQLLKANN